MQPGKDYQTNAQKIFTAGDVRRRGQTWWFWSHQQGVKHAKVDDSYGDLSSGKQDQNTVLVTL